jgi:hypothetical protein
MAVKYRLFQIMDDKKVAVKSGYDFGRNPDSCEVGRVDMDSLSTKLLFTAIEVNAFQKEQGGR